MNSIPRDQLKYRTYRSVPIMMAALMIVMSVLVTTGALWFGTTLADLVLPLIALVVMEVFSVALVAVALGMKASQERAGLDALIAGPVWATWQYTPEEWKLEYEQIYRGEKLQARASCSYLLFGPVIGAIFILAGYFSRSLAYSSFLIFVGLVVGGGVMLLGLAQFYGGRAQAQQHYAEAQKTPSPLLFFGQTGYYHQVAGFTSFRNLKRAEILSPGATDRLGQLTYAFVNKEYGGTNLSYLRFHMRHLRRRGHRVVTLAIPQRYEADAAALVARYTGTR